MLLLLLLLLLVVLLLLLFPPVGDVSCCTPVVVVVVVVVGTVSSGPRSLERFGTLPYLTAGMKKKEWGLIVYPYYQSVVLYIIHRIRVSNRSLKGCF